MVPCFTFLLWIWAPMVYLPYDTKTGSLFHLVASGGPTFSWSMSWAQIPKNGLFSSWNRWDGGREAGQVFGKGDRFTVYRGWLGYQQRSGTIYWRVRCQLEMPSLSRHRICEKTNSKFRWSNLTAGLYMFPLKILGFFRCYVCVRSPNPPKMDWNMSWI